MKRWRAFPAAALALALACGGLGGCAVNPATGEKVFTGGTTVAQEKEEGRNLHPLVLQEVGPEIANRPLQDYVASVGQLLARTVERQDLEYTFTVIDSDIVNAFALPGGYVYVTRGLLALFDSEAELAAVLGHELGHITALHHARGRGQAMLAQLGMLAASILTREVAPDIGEIVDQLGGTAALAYLRSFSRENEFESDDLGIRYLARAGYDTGAVASMLAKLRSNARFEAVLAGRSPDEVDRFHYTATHPVPAARIRRAKANAARTPVRDPMVARDVYLRQIDGMIHGGSPELGFMRGRHFIHPVLRFRFTVPEAFTVRNTPEALVATGRGGSQLIFSVLTRGDTVSAADFLRARWGGTFHLDRIDEFDMNGLPTATARFALRGRTDIFDFRILAAGARDGGVYELVFFSPRGNGAGIEDAYRTIRRSLREMDAREAASWRPRRLKVIRARPGDTQESLARRMKVDGRRLEHFRVLNGLGPGERIAAGRMLKIVVE